MRVKIGDNVYLLTCVKRSSVRFRTLHKKELGTVSIFTISNSSLPWASKRLSFSHTAVILWSWAELSSRRPRFISYLISVLHFVSGIKNGPTLCVQLGLPATWSIAKEAGATLEDIARWWSEKPAELANLKRKVSRTHLTLRTTTKIFLQLHDFSVKVQCGSLTRALLGTGAQSLRSWPT